MSYLNTKFQRSVQHVCILHHHVFLYLTFMYLSIPSSLLAEELLTLGEFCFTMIGRDDVEGSKSNVAMDACSATQAWLSLWVMGRMSTGWEGGYQDAPLKIYIQNR